jgi:hypothetical protein
MRVIKLRKSNSFHDLNNCLYSTKENALDEPAIKNKKLMEEILPMKKLV